MGYWDKKSIKEAKPQETVAGSESKSEIEIPEEFVDDLKKYEQDAINHVKDSTNYLSSQIKDQQKRMQTVTSDGYWFAVYFNNDMQKQECLEKLGFNQFDKYISGKKFMQAIKQVLESEDFEFGAEKNPVMDYSLRARSVKRQK